MTLENVMPVSIHRPICVLQNEMGVKFHGKQSTQSATPV